MASVPTLSVTIPTVAGLSPVSASTMGEPSLLTPQAGPLPRKRGEIGFTEGTHVQEQESGSSAQLTLPERHPEERQTSANVGATAAANGLSPTGATTTMTAAAATSGPQNVSVNALTTDASSTHSKRSFISFLKPKPTPLFAGLHADTLFRFALQLGFIILTIGGWVAVAFVIARRAAQTSDAAPDNMFSSGSAAGAFVHVAFSIAILTQVLFLERVIFLLRAERYVHLHPGAILPRTLRLDRRRSGSGNGGADRTALAIAPWNRPPLPTYAAALRESGHGTGDVEDAAIAVPPPPAYGTTRGSTMLLSGFMSTELRTQARAARGSQISEVSQRPVSYASRDGEWEERRDADRARRVEEALDRLEDGERGRRRSIVEERGRESDNAAAASVRSDQ